MKTFIFVVFCLLVTNLASAQNLQELKPDTARISLSQFADLNQPSLARANSGFELPEIKKFKIDSPSTQIPPANKLAPKIGLPQSEEKQVSPYKIRIFKPDITDNMPVHVPDSTISYSLRIKKIE